jgi:hypothetical protein
MHDEDEDGDVASDIFLLMNAEDHLSSVVIRVKPSIVIPPANTVLGID